MLYSQASRKTDNGKRSMLFSVSYKTDMEFKCN